jgi:UDP-hydrolysing UDP-N-acetyl-D-glucosamine 2-epimerase
MRIIKEHPDLELITICTGTMVLERFGNAVDVVREDGFEVESEIHIAVEGSTPETTAKTLGFSIIEFTTAFQRTRPDIVLIIGDRSESLGAMLAASYQNFCIVHIQGGEVSSSSDEMARHVMTKLSNYHFPATKRSAMYLEMMGEDPETIFPYGCPVADEISNTDLHVNPDVVNGAGIGGPIDITKDYFLAIYHPLTTQYYSKKEQVGELLSALQDIRMPTLWLWANIDPGADCINKAVRMHREYIDNSWLQVVKNFKPEHYQMLLANARVAIGNSSSFVRDASLLGTPVVLLGERQKGRETAENVLNCSEIKKDKIIKLINQQLTHGRYVPSNLYGEPGVSEKIVNTLAKIKIYNQKHLHYVKEQSSVYVSNSE